MPSNWQHWHSKVCSQLSINASLSVRAQPLRRPWFLVPTEKPELTEDQAGDLVSTVAQYLMPSATESVGRIRDRLEKLTPDASLPFLYAMRYIGYARARQNRYWPEFQKALFGDKLSYAKVAGCLADATASIWQNLYLETGRVLYYPSEGSVYIKWPLAHAGLHSDDKMVLRAFGLSLHIEDVGLLGHFVEAELDEFIVKFRDWLQEDGRHQASTIAEQLRRSDDETFLRAELAQQWLKLTRREIEKTARESEPEQQRGPMLRRVLAYRSASNEIGIIFVPTRKSQYQRLSIDWNGQTFPFIANTIPSTGERVFQDRFVPVYEPQWPSYADAQMDSAHYPISLPTINKDETLVFDVESGERTKRWQFDQTYHLLLPESKFQLDLAGHLFAQWYELNMPKGEWDTSYRFVWARTVRMPGDESTPDTGQVVAQQLQKLEEYASRMGLPNLRTYYQPRGRLLGQPLSQYGNGIVPTFLASDPPLLELQGIWSGDVPVTLKRRDSQTGQMLIEACLYISVSLAGKVPLIELWETKPSAGTYAITVDQDQMDLCLVSEEETSSIERPELRIQGHLAIEDDAAVERASRYAYDELSLTVDAWPSATLKLDIHHLSTQSHKELTVQVNEQGEWTAPLTSLPVEWAEFPPGDLSMQLSWRGLFLGQRLKLEDRHHVSACSLQMELTERVAGQYQIHCMGELQGAREITGFSGLLLPNPPWSREIPTFTLGMESDGFFEGSCRVNWRPHWLGIGRRDESLGMFTELLIVQRIENDILATYDKGVDLTHIATERISPQWRSVAPMIDSIAYPTDLHPFVQAEPLLSLLDEFHYEKIVGVRWVVATSWSDLQTVRQAIAHGHPLVLLQEEPSVVDFPSPSNCIEFEPFSETANLKELRFRFDALHTSYSCKLERGADNQFILRPHQTLRGCRKCQLIMPLDRFEGHTSLTGQEPSCTALNPTCIDYIPRSGCSDAVVIGVFTDPRSRFDAVIHDIHRILKDKAEPSAENQSIFKQLRACVPADCDPKKWLQGLAEAMVSVTELLFGNRRPSLKSVADCGRVLAGYENAACKILAEIVPASRKQSAVSGGGSGGD
jgi:hypothetical protein